MLSYSCNSTAISADCDGSGKYSWDNTSDVTYEHEGKGVFDDLLALDFSRSGDARRCGRRNGYRDDAPRLCAHPIEATVMPTLILDEYLQVSEALANAGMWRYVLPATCIKAMWRRIL
jgi:hypothetical protein